MRVSSALFAHFFICLLLVQFMAPAMGQDGLPRIASTELQEVSSYVYPEITVLRQSGERLVIDASLFSDLIEGDRGIENTGVLSEDFSFLVPDGRKGERFCVDLASRSSGFRMLSLLELIKPVNLVTAHIEAQQNENLDTDGAVLVAFRAQVQSENPLKACLMQDEWLYPVHVASAIATLETPTLQLRINTGGGGASISQLNAAGAVVGDPSICKREDSPNGLYNRVCRLKLFRDQRYFARIRLTIGQRNASSIRKDFNIALARREK